MKTIILAAALLLPAGAQAATWTEQAPGTYTRTVQLDGGRDYALAASVAHGSGITLDLAAGATKLAHVDVPDDGGFVDGTTFRAPRSGPYTLTMTIPGDQPAGCDCGVQYAIGPDCAGGPSTLCALPVGKSDPGRFWNYDGDDDWFRTLLRGRQRYEAWLKDPSDCRRAFRVIDAQGREVPSSTVGHPGDGISIRFTPAANGTYFIAALGTCDGTGPYGVALYAR